MYQVLQVLVQELVQDEIKKTPDATFDDKLTPAEQELLDLALVVDQGINDLSVRLEQVAAVIFQSPDVSSSSKDLIVGILVGVAQERIGLDADLPDDLDDNLAQMEILPFTEAEKKLLQNLQQFDQALIGQSRYILIRLIAGTSQNKADVVSGLLLASLITPAMIARLEENCDNPAE
jgi:hypothetical protein